jgi:glycosyltransferase involved in cell wall biosynthesis
MARLSVLLDAGAAVHQHAGLARYTERLAYHLHHGHRDGVDLALFFNAHSGHALPPSLDPLPRHSLRLGQYAWRLSVLASQLARLPVYEQRLPPSQLYHATEHLLPRLVRPSLLTVHDLIFERYPQHHTLTNRLFLKVGMPLFVRAAHQIIAVSDQTKRDLMALYRVAGEKIAVIYEGVDERFRPAPVAEVERVRRDHGLSAPYLLMVGTLEPRKNHATALRALAHLRAEGLPHTLVIVGGHGWLFEPIQQLVGELGLADAVRFTGRIPDADLIALYSGAACFLMPSLYEGFGFPVLEALACGAPVVASNVSSLPEVAGEAALLVGPEDVAGWAEAIWRTVQGQGPSLPPGHLARFTWQACAAQTADLYRAVAGG